VNGINKLREIRETIDEEREIAMRYLTNLLTALMILAVALPATAGRIRLATLPDRDDVQIRFEDNGSVLVEEQRVLTLDRGSNRLDFTWMGVQIQRDSIQMLPVGVDGIRVIRTNSPAGESNSLVWDVYADKAGAVPVRISYLLSGLSRELAMRAVIRENDAGEERLDLRVDQRLANNSGESFGDAKLLTSFGELRPTPLNSGEIRRQLSAKFKALPFERRYTYDPQALSTAQVVVHYVLENTEDGGLGKTMLPGAKLRLFQEANGSEAFLGEDNVRPTALGEEMAIRIGTARDITVRRSVMENKRSEVQGNLHHDLMTLRFEVENFAGAAKTVRLVEHTYGEWDMNSPVQTLEKRIAPEQYEPVPGEPNIAAQLTREDIGQLVIDLPVPPERRVVFEFTLRRRNLH
jgi:hypothetical protein